MGIYKNSLTSETEELYLKEIILENYTNIFKVGRKKKDKGNSKSYKIIRTTLWQSQICQNH